MFGWEGLHGAEILGACDWWEKSVLSGQLKNGHLHLHQQTTEFIEAGSAGILYGIGDV